MLLSNVFDVRAIKTDLTGTSKEEIFRELVDALAAVHPELDNEAVLAAILERENKMSTAIDGGIAIPHGYCPEAGGVFGAAGVSAKGIAYGPPEDKPVHCVFLLVMGEAAREKHLRVLNRVMQLVNSGIVTHIQNSKNPEEIHRLLARAG
jgi:mannitol/fructose-specific phosphotransferase system IIA component (Ntr-type)